MNIDPVLALDTARRTSGWTALGLGAAVSAAATGGGIAGSTMWPGHKHSDGVTSRHSVTA